MNDLFPDTNCKHPTKTLVLTPETIHHGKEVCAECGKFLGWVKKPETIERDKENHRKLAFLKTVLCLDEWEKGFLLSLEKQGRHYSPAQQSNLDRIYTKYE